MGELDKIIKNDKKFMASICKSEIGMHKLSESKLLKALERRGWKLNEPSHSWERPLGLTRAQAEQNWRDAVLEAIECPHEKDAS